MFDVAPTEFLLVAVVALLVIGPKDLPKAMRFVGHWVGRMRGVARQFRSGFDTMVREAELEEMEKRWASENARIMAEHGAGAGVGAATADPTHDAAAAGGVAPANPFDGAGSLDSHHVDDATTEPVYVEQPEIRPSLAKTTEPRGDGVTS